MVHSAVDYIAKAPARPWLVLGKGPTLNRLRSVAIVGYNVISLNHACLVRRPDIAHFTDWEAMLDCWPKLAGTGVAICMPWHPHMECKATKRTLMDLPHPDGLGWCKLAEEGKLLSYNSTVAVRSEKHPDLPTIKVRYFSAVAAFNLLAAAKVKQIFSLGVDGGKGYAQDMNPKDRLANGRNSFDIQFKEIARTVRRHQISWRKL